MQLEMWGATAMRPSAKLLWTLVVVAVNMQVVVGRLVVNRSARPLQPRTMRPVASITVVACCRYY